MKQFWGIFLFTFITYLTYYNMDDLLFTLRHFIRYQSSDYSEPGLFHKTFLFDRDRYVTPGRTECMKMQYLSVLFHPM